MSTINGVTRTAAYPAQNELQVGHPIEGVLTWQAEGSSNPLSPYYSRRAHWPGGRSGITIGRGYDLGQRSRQEIMADLLRSGVDAATAAMFASAAGVSGTLAQRVLAQRRFPELTAMQEQALFRITIERYERLTSALLFGSKPHSFAHWRQLPVGLREVLVDLRYRGDLTAQHTRLIRILLQRGDLETVCAYLADPNVWLGKSSLTRQRFLERANFLYRMGALRP